jgi:hypothetical protein
MNTLAYLALSSETKEKSFITLTPVGPDPDDAKLVGEAVHAGERSSLRGQPERGVNSSTVFRRGHNGF